MPSSRAVLFAMALVGCSKPEAPVQEAAPTYHEDVAPILRKHCLGCHRPGGVGHGDLSTYERASDTAYEIAMATADGRMPPWPAASEQGCPPLEGERRLNADEVATLVDWARTGASEGERPAALPDLPEPYGALARVARVLRGEAPYLPVPGTDDYRCFVVDPALTEDAYLTAFAVREDVPGVIHHVQLWAFDTAEAEAELDGLDAAAPGSGYPCLGAIGAPGRYVSVWAPSDPVRRHPPGTGIQLLAGRRMVVQIHYHDDGVGLPDHTQIELELATTVEHPAEQWTLSAANLVLPPGLDNVTATGSLAVTGGPSYRLWGTRAHMHTLGKSISVTLGDAETSRCLLSIPAWDPAWQLMYFFSDPIAIAQGDRLGVSCTYDTRGKTRETRDGMGTDDEMCFAFFYVSR